MVVTLCHFSLHSLISSSVACFVLGLIVGAIIRYTNKPTGIPEYASAQILGNRTYYSDDAPTILYVNYTNRNATTYSVKQYDLGATVDEPISEPPLEKTVFFNASCTLFKQYIDIVLFSFFSSSLSLTHSLSLTLCLSLSVCLCLSFRIFLKIC